MYSTIRHEDLFQAFYDQFRIGSSVFTVEHWTESAFDNELAISTSSQVRFQQAFPGLGKSNLPAAGYDFPKKMHFSSSSAQYFSRRSLSRASTALSGAPCLALWDHQSMQYAFSMYREHGISSAELECFIASLNKGHSCFALLRMLNTYRLVTFVWSVCISWFSHGGSGRLISPELAGRGVKILLLSERPEGEWSCVEDNINLTLSTIDLELHIEICTYLVVVGRRIVRFRLAHKDWSFMPAAEHDPSLAQLGPGCMVRSAYTPHRGRQNLPTRAQPPFSRA